jgi:enoyl-CoA hydratase
MSEPLVIRDQQGAIVTLTLNRPDKRNALNIALWTELDAHLDSIAAAGDALAVIVLRSNGPVFCAGNDLKERGVETPRPHFQASIVTRLAQMHWRAISSWRGKARASPTRTASLRSFRSGG